MSDERTVSEDLFRRQLDVTEKLAGVVMDNATATKGVAETIQGQQRLLEKIDERNEGGRKEAVTEVKEHMTEQADRIAEHFTTVIERLEFKPRRWWISIAILALSLFAGSPVADRLLKAVGILR